MGISSVATFFADEKDSTWPRGFMANRNYRRQIRAKLFHFLAGDPLNQIQPVRADVGDRAQFAAKFGFQPPVPVGRIREPVLQESAVDQLHLPDRARFDQRPSPGRTAGSSADCARRRRRGWFLWQERQSCADSRESIASGFSHRTCLPARNNFADCSKCT